MIKQNAKLKIDKKGQTYTHESVLFLLHRKNSKSQKNR